MSSLIYGIDGDGDAGGRDAGDDGGDSDGIDGDGDAGDGDWNDGSGGAKSPEATALHDNWADQDGGEVGLSLGEGGEIATQIQKPGWQCTKPNQIKLTM